MPEKANTAIIYDWIDKWGGVERVLLTLDEIFPEAQFYTSYYNQKEAGWAKKLKIRTSFIQKFPSFIRENRMVSLPFYPYAFESFDFSKYDLVISVTSSFAKSVITKPGVLHICYLLTPTRFLWSQPDDYLKNKALKYLSSPYLAKLRKWDLIAAQRPDKIISISRTVADRCRKYYKRESEVIYPPFDIKYWKNIKKNVILGTNEVRTPESLLDSGRARSSLARMTTENKKYFLVVSRLEPYKRVDLVIQLFNQLKQTLVIVGEGSKLKKFKQIANENIIFFSKLTDQELAYLYNKAEALIMPQEEDFGYVSLEAQFFGCTVIAYRKAGATETISEGKTGIFFEEQSVSSLISALQRYNVVKYELKHTTQELGQKNIVRFSKLKFKRDLIALLNSKLINLL